MSAPRRPGFWRVALAALVLACHAPLNAATDLPSGFGGISVGDQWPTIEGAYTFESMNTTTSGWEELVAACGYRSVRLSAENGELLLTVNDFVVTDISFVSPIKEDSDLVQVADLVMKNYGQPDRASMRDRVGNITIDQGRVNYIALDYKSGKKIVQITIAGNALWRYQVKVLYEHQRWHENKNLQCARQREAEQKKAAASG